MSAIFALFLLCAPGAQAAARYALVGEPTAHQAPGARAWKLASFGLEGAGAPGGLLVHDVFPGSRAAELGFKPGDLVTHLLGEDVNDPDSAARALAGLKPEGRAWAVARRGRSVVVLESDLSKVQLTEARDPERPTPFELERRQALLEAAKAKTPELLQAKATPRLAIPAGQRTWVAFQAGLLPGLKPGDVVAGSLLTGIASGPELDYLIVPPNSLVYAEIAEASSRDGVRSARPHFFKLALAGGHAYPMSAKVSDIAGDHTLTQVSGGGTLVTADPGGLGPDTKVQLELLKPLVLFEAPGSYKAGPGFWVKPREAGKERTFEVTQVAAGRSAERAGVQAGDELVAIDEKPVQKLDFLQVIERLYGAAGTKVKVRIKRGSGGQASLELDRGVRFEPQLGFEADFGATKDDGLPIRSVAQGSPAARAGIKAGDRILRVGSLEVEGLTAAQLRQLLGGDLVEENEITVRGADGGERRLSLKREPAPALVPYP